MSRARRVSGRVVREFRAAGEPRGRVGRQLNEGEQLHAGWAVDLDQQLGQVDLGQPRLDQLPQPPLLRSVCTVDDEVTVGELSAPRPPSCSPASSPRFSPGSACPSASLGIRAQCRADEESMFGDVGPEGAVVVRADRRGAFSMAVVCGLE